MKLFTRRSASILLSLVCTCTVFTYLLRTVQPSEIIQVFKDLDLTYLAGFVSLSLLGSYFRACRYKVTLVPAGYSPATLPLFLITLVRNFTSDLLPARLGSAIYIYLAKTHLGVSLSAATSSFALTFLFDLLVLAPLFGIIAAIEYHAFVQTGISVLILGVSVSSICLVLLLYLDQILSFTVKKTLPLRLIPEALVDFAQTLSSDVAQARSSGIYYRLFLLSVLVRLCKYGSLYIFLVGILVPLGYSPFEIPILKSLLGILSAEVAASLPISGIAGFGAYEGAWTAAFNLMGFPLDLSKLTAITHHLFTQLYGYSLGALALLLLSLPYRRILFFLNTPKRVLITTLLFWVVLASYLFAAPMPHITADQSFQPRSSDGQTTNTFKGKIIFDSRRGKTFGIYSIQAGEILTVVDTPKWHETYPDISPDGTQLVYSRSRSLSRHAPAQIWLLDLKTGENKQIIKEGTFPTFGHDNNTIYYEFERKKVMRLSLLTGETTEIFPDKTTSFSGNQVVKPRLSHDEKFLSFTSDHPSPWYAWRVDLTSGSATKIAKGCEPAWYPDGNSAWIKKEGLKAGSGIMVYDPAKKASSLLLDDGPPLGHEYFPSISPDGRFLLYSAAPHDQHDHLSAAYQLFLLNLETGESKQLTSDGFTNRWPKLVPTP